MSNPTPETMTDSEIAKISKSDSPTDSSMTVKFNVGGRHYEVSRSLIERFPSTMLAKMISETWQKDPEVTLFIDRDRDRFRFCLDYMRVDKVWLPIDIPKEAFLDDLDFYGFEDVDSRKIHGGSSYLAAARHLSKRKREHEEVLSTCRKNVKAAETTSKCEDVAYECFLRLSQGKSLKMFFSCKSEPELSISAAAAISNKPVFQEHLAMYGLELVKGEYNAIHGRYYLTLKEEDTTRRTLNNMVACLP
jgi:hypothetical protein